MNNLSRRRVVIIGAGIGGLSAAMVLLGKGIDVVVLEKQATPGGKLRQIEIGNQQIDSGPTVFTLRRVFDDLFALAGDRLDDQVELWQSEHIARHSWQDSPSLDLFSNIDESATAIEEFSSAQEAAKYRTFAERSKHVFSTLDLAFMRAQRPNPMKLSFGHGLRHAFNMSQIQPMMSLWKNLENTFSDPRLRQLFGRYSTYCGSSPFQAPATLMLIAHAERTGIYQLRGGMQSLANAMAGSIERMGGDLRYNSSVARIETKDKKVTGVTLEDETRIEADAVIFNGDTQALTRGLLGQSVTRSAPTRQQPSLSATTHCLVGKATGFDLAYHTVLFGSDYRDEFDSIFNRQTITDLPTVYVCAQDRGPAHSALSHTAGNERFFCLVNSPATTTGTPAAAEAAERASNQMLKTMQAHGLQLVCKNDDSVLTTPSDFAQRFPGSDGALYGNPTHGWLSSFKRPGSRSKIPGLYLAGGGVHPGAGLPMVCLSGQLAAQSLLKDLQ